MGGNGQKSGRRRADHPSRAEKRLKGCLSLMPLIMGFGIAVLYSLHELYRIVK